MVFLVLLWYSQKWHSSGMNQEHLLLKDKNGVGELPSALTWMLTESRSGSRLAGRLMLKYYYITFKQICFCCYAAV